MKTKIKRVHLVSEDELKTLAKAINFCIKHIIEGEEKQALWTLERLYENLNKTLKEKSI